MPLEASVTLDAPTLTVPCAVACQAMQRVGCPVFDNCERTLADEEHFRLIREPSTGHALLCTDVADAGTKPAMRALGVDCP